MGEDESASKGNDLHRLLKESLVKIRDLKERLNRYELSKTEPIAVIGLGCRFPGGGTSPEAFWHALRNGTDAVREIPVARWRADAIPDAAPGTRFAGLL